MKYSVILPAAGKAERAKLGYNKSLFLMNGKPLIQYSVDLFIKDSDCEEIIIAVGEGELEEFQKYLPYPSIRWTLGGPCREASVYNALKLSTSPYTLVHDAARPFISMEVVQHVKEGLKTFQSVIPVLPLGDRVVPDRVLHNSKGEGFIVQTPQGFETKLLKRAFDQAHKGNSFSYYKDDASIVEFYEHVVAIHVLGDPQNVKATYPSDFKK